MRRIRRLPAIDDSPAPPRHPSAAPGRGRGFLLVALSGAALTLAFPEPDLAPLAWVALAPLIGVVAGVGPRRGFVLGAAFGICFFGTLLYWVSIVGYAAWLILVLMQAFYVGVFGALWALVASRLGGAARLLAPAILWVAIVELLRSITPVVGFTWGQLAQSQHDVPFVLRSAGWGGAWTVALLLVLVNTLVAAAAGAARRRELRPAGAAALGAAAVLLLPAPWPSPRATGRPVAVAIVQGNIPETQPASYEKDLVILDNHVRLTGTVPPEADLVVWAESSVGIDPSDPAVSDALARAATSVDRPMVVGGNRARGDGRYQVMAYQLSERGEIVDEYQKTHLVPFGEYVPARRLIGWVPGLEQVPLDAVPGDEEVVFDVAGGRVAPVISFEGDFGSLAAGRIRGGGRLLVVLTNTSTWRHSWASAQHVAMSQVRAAESGVHVAHAALTGISAFIDPSGAVVSRTELWKPEVLLQELRFAEDVTLYARTGDWLAYGSVLAAAALVAASLTGPRWRRKAPSRRRPSAPATREPTASR